MSYTILYAKQFVKLSNGNIIPMMLAGSNNCYTTSRSGKEIRSRDWQVMTYHTEGKFDSPAAALLANVEKEIQSLKNKCGRDEWYIKEGYTPEQIEKNFGWYSSLAIGSAGTGATSADKYRSFFRSGVKNAVSIETLAKIGVTLRVYSYKWHTDSYTVPPPSQEYIRTEEEYYAVIAAWQQWRQTARTVNEAGNQSEDIPSVYLVLSPNDHEAVLDLLERLKVKKEKKPQQNVTVNGFYVLRNSSGFLVKYVRRGFRYAYSMCSSVKAFQTEAEAEKFRAKLVREGKHMADTWKVVPMEGQRTFRKAV